MRCPAELYTVSTRTYDGLPELTYPFHDRDVLVTACGRLCLHRKKINISTVLAGQRLGNKRLGYPVAGHRTRLHRSEGNAISEIVGDLQIT
jgi:hypothetical protein